MSMTPGELRAYRRGWNGRNKWPDHRPPVPPDPLIAGLMEAADRLRGAADYFCATCEPDEPETKQMRDAIDALDEAMAAVGRWLKEAAE